MNRYFVRLATRLTAGTYALLALAVLLIIVAIYSANKPPDATTNANTPRIEQAHQLTEVEATAAVAAEANRDTKPSVNQVLAKEEKAKQLFGFLWRRHLEISARFKTYESQTQNDQSELQLLAILHDCLMVYEAENKSQIAEIFESIEPSPVKDSILETMMFIFDDCKKVQASLVTEHKAYWSVESELINRSANQGNATAKLIKIQRTSLTEKQLPKVSKLLNEALRTKDYQAFEQARSLFNHFHHEDPTLQIHFWNAAVCKHDPYCDFDMYQSNSTQLFTHEIETINYALERLERRLEDPTPIPFQQMFSSPLQMSNGEMWFERQD